MGVTGFVFNDDVFLFHAHHFQDRGNLVGFFDSDIDQSSTAAGNKYFTNQSQFVELQGVGYPVRTPLKVNTIRRTRFVSGNSREDNSPGILFFILSSRVAGTSQSCINSLAIKSLDQNKSRNSPNWKHRFFQRLDRRNAANKKNAHRMSKGMVR